MKDIIKTVGLIIFALVGLSNVIYANNNAPYYNPYVENTITEKTNHVEQFELNYNFKEDEFNGPGIGMKTNTWDGTLVNRIYSYGNLNNIVGDEVVNGLAYSCEAPGTNMMPSEVYNAEGPGFLVNAFTSTETTDYVDMGPQAISSVVNPSDYVKILNSKPSDLAEACVPLKNAKDKKDKKNKNTTKS